MHQPWQMRPDSELTDHENTEQNVMLLLFERQQEVLQRASWEVQISKNIYMQQENEKIKQQIRDLQEEVGPTHLIFGKAFKNFSSR